MPKQILLNQITLCADGSIGLQWLKQVLDPDTGEVLFSEPHRSVIDFDAADLSQIDGVAQHLQTLGYAVSPIALTRFKAIAQKVLNIANGDAEIKAARQVKVAQKVEAEKARLASEAVEAAKM